MPSGTSHLPAQWVWRWCWFLPRCWWLCTHRWPRPCECAAAVCGELSPSRHQIQSPEKERHTIKYFSLFSSWIYNKASDRSYIFKERWIFNHPPLNFQPTTVWSYSPRTATSIPGGYCVDGMGFIFSCVKNMLLHIYNILQPCCGAEDLKSARCVWGWNTLDT